MQLPAQNPSASNQRSPLVRFFDAFLQDQNIKWVLSAGMLILLGSSMMMVRTHWTHFNPLVRQLIILGYAGAIYSAGWWSYHRLSLRKTGTMLFALTVMLLPITFLAITWVNGPDWQHHSLTSAADGPSLALQTIVMLIATMTLAATASRRIFHHFLRGHQPTFVASYLLLAVAGAFAPTLGNSWPISSSFLLWAVFAIGSVKVSRYLFWLVERHDAPKVFGFFPILLLGTQFLGLFAVYFGPHIPIGWLGFGCLLVAVPVLLITDTLYDVFQKRTADLQQTLPLSILTPFAVALLLIATGVCLSAFGLSTADGKFALVPSAALAAMMMATIARRTGRQAFVWAMLVLVMTAYQCSPVFFKEVALQFADQARQAMNEPQRLPLAFYGLTYLPLIALFTAAAVVLGRQSKRLFARPLEFFSIALSLVLLVASWTYPTAMFPVGFVMAVTLLGQMVIFGRRWMLLPGIAAAITAAVGLSAFAVTVLDWQWMTHRHLDCLAAVTIIITSAGWLVDRWVSRLRFGLTSRQLEWLGLDTLKAQRSQALLAPLRTIGLLLTLIAAAIWIQAFATQMAAATWLSALLFVGLLIAFSLIHLQSALSFATICFAQLAGVAYAISFLGWNPKNVIGVVACQLLIQWGGMVLLRRSPQRRISRAFASASECYATIGLITLFSVVYMPVIASRMLASEAQWFGQLPWMWPIFTLLVAWTFDATRRWSSPVLGAAGCLGVLILIGSASIQTLSPLACEWLPALWTATALVSLPIAEHLRRRLVSWESNVPPAEDVQRYLAFYRPIIVSIFVVFGLSVALSLGIYTMPMWIAGIAGSAGLFVIALMRGDRQLRLTVVALANWQVIAAWLVFLTASSTEQVGSLAGFFALSAAAMVSACIGSLLVATMSLLLWQWAARETDTQIAEFQRGLLRIVAGLALAGPMFLASALDPVSIAMVTIGFALLTTSELWAACRTGETQRVWFAQTIVAAAIGYLAWFDFIHYGNGWAPYCIMAGVIILWLCGRGASRSQRTQIISRPLMQTAMWLPALAVGISVLRQTWALGHVADMSAMAFDQLALLLAAAWYFWRAIEGQCKWLFIVSALIVNTGLILLWQRIGWTDPQLTMIPLGASLLALVELFKREIGDELRDPLRYAAALVILVSPTFEIVGGSWTHIMSLLVVSVIVMLLGMGLRVRAILYAAVAFLVADLLAMVVRGSMDMPNLLWIVGILLGAAVVLFGAIAENNRERLLQRLRILSARMDQWE